MECGGSPGLVGTGRAIEMILTGRRIATNEAHQLRVVTAVMPTDELLPAAFDCGLAKGPLAVRLAELDIPTGIDADQRTGC